MKKRYECNQCGAPALLDLQNATNEAMETHRRCARYFVVHRALVRCAGEMVESDKKRAKPMRLI